MQNVGKTNDGGNNTDLKTLHVCEGNRAQTTTLDEKSQDSPVSNFMPEMSGSDDEDVSEVCYVHMYSNDQNFTWHPEMLRMLRLLFTP